MKNRGLDDILIAVDGLLGFPQTIEAAHQFAILFGERFT